MSKSTQTGAKVSSWDVFKALAALVLLALLIKGWATVYVLNIDLENSECRTNYWRTFALSKERPNFRCED